jgi:hypothetical protein
LASWLTAPTADHHRQHQRELAERLDDPPADQAVVEKRDGSDREDGRQPRGGQGTVHRRETTRDRSERAGSEQVERIAPVERDDQDVRDPDEGHPDGRENEVLDERRKVVLEAADERQVDVDVELVVVDRSRRGHDAGRRAVGPGARRQPGLPAGCA